MSLKLFDNVKSHPSNPNQRMTASKSFQLQLMAHIHCYILERLSFISQHIQEFDFDAASSLFDELNIFICSSTGAYSEHCPSLNPFFHSVKSCFDQAYCNGVFDSTDVIGRPFFKYLYRSILSMSIENSFSYTDFDFLAFNSFDLDFDEVIYD